MNDEGDVNVKSGLGARADGRSQHQLRTLVCERGLLSRADGSARWCQGHTELLAAVHGPRQTTVRREDPERAVLIVHWKPASGLAGTREKHYEMLLRRALEGVMLTAQHPRTEVVITVQVVSSDGGDLPCAVNAACAALVDAAVPLQATIVAASCMTATDGRLMLDPTAAEEEEAEALGTFAFMARVEDPAPGAAPVVAEGITLAHAAGLMAAPTFVSMADLARRACKRVAGFNQLSLEKSFAALG